MNCRTRVTEILWERREGKVGWLAEFPQENWNFHGFDCLQLSRCHGKWLCEPKFIDAQCLFLSHNASLRIAPSMKSILHPSPRRFTIEVFTLSPKEGRPRAHEYLQTFPYNKILIFKIHRTIALRSSLFIYFETLV